MNKIPTAVALYESGLSTIQIGVKMGMSRSSVVRRLQTAGIARRNSVNCQEARSKSETVEFTPSQKQLILGSLLGDACLT